MIKLAKFKFEERATENHWIDFALFGNPLSCDVVSYNTWKDFNEHLSPDEHYQIGMDQSSSCTGVVIKNYRNTEFYMIEFKRQSGEDASDYLFMFEQTLHSLCDGCSITHIIYEKPIKSDNFQSSRVLFQLEGIILQLGKRYKEFSTAKIDNIENAAWRSHVIIKSYASMDRKRASEESIKQIYPWSRNYGMSIGKDRDVFEAVGILMGWFLCSFDPLGRPYVRGDRSKSTIGGYILFEADASELAHIFINEGINAYYAIANPRYSVAKNVSTSVGKNQVFCVEFTDKYSMLALCIESNLKWINPSKMTVVLCDANAVPEKLKEIAGTVFHFVY